MTSIAPQPEARIASAAPPPDPLPGSRPGRAIGGAGPAALPARGRPPGDDRADLGRAAGDGRRRDAGRAPCRCLLALPARPRRSVPDARRDERPRPLPDRPGAGAVRRGRDRPRRGAPQRPQVIPDVRADPRFLWVRGIDQRRFVASMLSVPLTWHDQIVGVLNVQTEQPREFSDADVAQLGAVADLLAGIVEKGRQQSEAEARVEALKAIDEARSELIALVTHELRTPLAVVRAYTDLLAEEPPLAGRESRDIERRADAGRVAPRDARADRAARPPRRLDPRLGPGRARRTPRASAPVDVEALVAEVLAVAARRCSATTTVAISGDAPPARPGRPAAAAPDRRAPRRERGQVRPAGARPSRSTGRSSRASSSSASATRARASPTSGASGSSSRTPAATRTPPAARASACMPPSDSANRWARTCGASPPDRTAPASSSPCRPPSPSDPMPSPPTTEREDHDHHEQPPASDPRRRRRPGHGRGHHRARRHRGPPGHHRLRRPDRRQALPRGASRPRPARPRDARAGRLQRGRPDAGRRPGADPRRVRRERRGRQGPGARASARTTT